MATGPATVTAAAPPTVTPTVTVIGGVDTHKHTHYAAAIDDQGRLLGHREFPANDHGYQALLAWIRSHGVRKAAQVVPFSSGRTSA
jgi:hypothetical protein